MSDHTYRCGTRHGLMAEAQMAGAGQVLDYELPKKRTEGTIYLQGPWVIENAALVRPPDASGESLAVVPYSGTRVSAFMDAGGGAAGVNVFRDGYPIPERVRGVDVILPGRFTVVEVTGNRAYDLIRDPHPGEHELRLSTRSAGLKIHSIVLTQCTEE